MVNLVHQPTEVRETDNWIVQSGFNPLRQVETLHVSLPFGFELRIVLLRTFDLFSCFVLFSYLLSTGGILSQKLVHARGNNLVFLADRHI